MMQNGLPRRVELQQFERTTLVKMPNLVRCDLMPAAKATLREEEVDGRQRGPETASILRGDLNFGTEYLPIEAALRMRPQIQRCDQLSGSRVYCGKCL